MAIPTPVSFWNLDESSGNAADAVGSNTLVNNNTATFGAGKINNCADFEASGTQFFECADNAGLSITGDMTLAGWVNFETFGEKFLAKYTPTGNQRSYYANFQDQGGGMGKFALEYSSTGANAVEHLSNAFAFSTGTWYHFALVFVAASHATTFYKDGSAIGTDSSGALTAIFDSTAVFRLGTRSDDGAGYFDGKMDMVGIWNVALSGTDISDLYNGGAGLQYPFAAAAAGFRGLTAMGVGS